MSTAKKILGNTAVQVAGRAMMAAASVVILKIITSFLSVEEYGMYASIYEFLAFFGIAADLGLFTIAVREMGKGKRDRSFIVSNILGMRMLLAFTTMSAAVISAALIGKFTGTYIPTGVMIASIAVFFVIMHGTVSSVLQVELKMQYATMGLVGGKFISLSWMLATIYFFYAGDPGSDAFYQLIWAGVFGNIFAFLFSLFFARKYAKIWPQFNWGYWKEISVTALPYGTALILNIVYFRIDSLMLLFMKGPSEVAIYSPAVRMMEILSVVPIYFMNSVLPVLSRHVEEGSKRVSRMIRLSFDFLFMLGMPMAVGVYLIAYPLIFLITQPEFLSRLDEGFYGSDIALQILVFAMFFAYLNSLFTYSLVAVNKQSHLLWINGTAAVFNIAANFYVIPEWGFRGAAVTSIITEIYILLMAWLIARKWIDYKLDWLAFCKTVVATAAMGLTVWKLTEPTYNFMNLQNFNVFLLAGIGAAVYGAVLLLLKAVPEEFMRKIHLGR
ncbi:flippase [Candidatus Peregrinibacteria bacterium]|jgi:O-antigen/teichoic acid export membrane protein|nr:flippase [Candidatus Peregrinibacteria bacterium]MBT4631773.1 flippase [Candidatus Peregrinibacteria bacterium]MBT5516836.1 flippase [Candidatus Peregrinibacteria bacterium]MBT5824502.1 flippase [Candidatus Peregrinibacteria bacterium]